MWLRRFCGYPVRSHQGLRPRQESARQTQNPHNCLKKPKSLQKVKELFQSKCSRREFLAVFFTVSSLSLWSSVSFIYPTFNKTSI